MTILLIRLRVLVVRAVFAVARHLPLRPRVVLATAHDAALRGNLAVLRDGLLRADPAVEVVGLAHAARGDWRGRIRAVWFASKAAYHLATARLFIVDDYYFPIYVIRPRPGTVIVQTWHGSGAFKKFGYSVLDKSFGATETLTSRVRIHSNYDLCLVSSAAVAPFYAEAFGQPIERFRADLGIPRTDPLFDVEAVARTSAAVRARFGITADRRVILYAPTFRGDSVTSAVAGPMLDLRMLYERLGDDHVVLLRLHPFVRAGVAIPSDLAGFVIDIADHPDINDLLLASDVLVTDYSSVIFEYALLDRPMALLRPGPRRLRGRTRLLLRLPHWRARPRLRFDRADRRLSARGHLRPRTRGRVPHAGPSMSWTATRPCGSSIAIVRPALAGAFPTIATRGPERSACVSEQRLTRDARARPRPRSLYDTALPVHARHAQPASSTLSQEPRTPMTFRAKPVVKRDPETLVGEPRPTQLLPQPRLRPHRRRRDPHPGHRARRRTTTTRTSPRSAASTASPSRRPNCATARQIEDWRLDQATERHPHADGGRPV